MLSNESKIDIISEIIHDHLKGKHKDQLSRKIAGEIVEALSIDEEPPTWYIHG